jgi:hypothetical protein
MQDKVRLLVVVSKAASTAMIGGFALVIAVMGSKIVHSGVGEKILGLIAAFLPIGTAVWWIFGKLQAFCTRREARAVTVAFAMFSPIWFGGAILLSELTGGYAEVLLGSPFALLGVLVGLVGVSSLVSFGMCLFTWSVTRQIIRLAVLVGATVSTPTFQGLPSI